MSGSLEIVKPGLQTTVQDFPGRVGFWRFGIPPSGPMDALAFRLANLLVGNEDGAAAIEMQFVGPSIRFRAGAHIAITGGDCAPTLDEQPVAQWQTIEVRAGQILSCSVMGTGARAYLAVSGGLEKPLLMGSRATFPRGEMGGGALKAGDSFEFPDSSGDLRLVRVSQACIPDYPSEIPVAVTRGPHFDWLDDAGRETFLAVPWKVSGQSDRTGIRLVGPKLSFSRRAVEKAPENGPDPTNVINTGYPIGGVNFCGETLIVLPVDGPSQGGFITPFVVPSGALWKIGQARPGQTISFQLIPVNEAINLRRGLEALVSTASLEPAKEESPESSRSLNGAFGK